MLNPVTDPYWMDCYRVLECSAQGFAGRTIGDPDFTVSATASSGLPVGFTASGKCTVSGSKVHLTGVGSCTIGATQAGNGAYYPAPTVHRSFAIAQGAARTCRVPKVVGMRLATAKRTITARRCLPGRVRFVFSSTFKKGVVVSQSRRPGKVVPARTRIHLSVSR
jgi:chitinase